MFAAESNDVSLSDAGFTSQTGHQVIIRTAQVAAGIAASANPEQFDWLLTPVAASQFADVVEQPATHAKGHQYLDSKLDQCTVMVSLNEYPHDFLLRPPEARNVR